MAVTVRPLSDIPMIARHKLMDVSNARVLDSAGGGWAFDFGRISCNDQEHGTKWVGVVKKKGKCRLKLIKRMTKEKDRRPTYEKSEG